MWRVRALPAGARVLALAGTRVLVLAGAAVLALAGGCGSGDDGPRMRAVPPRPPAAAAGGACELLDYAVVEQVLGTRFEVSAAGRQNATYTCVLQPSKASLPDLTLAVTPTAADAAIFRSTVTPRGGTAVTGLGKAAYRLPVAAAAKRGPGVEIGWLSSNNRLMMVTYTTPAGTAPAAAAEAGAKLLQLAQKIDKASV